MPQLDRIIVFPQIFWLFVIFVSTYVILTHFFLPKFVKSLKSRKLIIEANNVELSALTSKIVSKQLLLKQLLLNNLMIIDDSLNCELSISDNLLKLNLHKVDEKMGIAAFNASLYCDVHLFNCISFYPKFLNNTFKLV
uniref:ATP synthase F0 subunit 8 n=1 Tax=Sarcopeltis skottsbergii TaxID=2765380 RepID=A0A7M3VH30_SARSK|nr:ATP synthase F0 subunit 8 [Sarcopeltis skottsbergii]QOS04475.1 ATP synthase F0 subunit 8 [Sarcopeltis skottsbergii]